ncbi:MAG: response regulator [Deltaproteobacteria bacterium]|nr:response regulator [Deltaproteobacteria bacterium]
MGNITHELKTPLHSILAIAQLLRSEVDGVLNSEQRRQVEMILKNGDSLLELITHLLQYSDLESGTRRAQYEEFKPKEFLEELRLTVEPIAQKGGITIEANFGQLAGMFVSDRRLLRQAISNLISNALKFSPRGGHLALYAATLHDGSLLVEVADSGIGIPQEAQEMIFSEFYQVERTDARRYGGVGLGLTLVKTALELLGGKIELRSEVGQASLFRVTIPNAPERLKRRRILVVDADSAICLALESSFRKEGFEVECGGDADRIESRVAEFRPELIILDIRGFDASGVRALQHTTASSWGRDIPVMVMSSVDGAKERSRAFELGAADYMVKPFDLAELLARVRLQLERVTLKSVA